MELTNGQLTHLIQRMESAIWGSNDVPGLVGHVAQLREQVDSMSRRQKWAVWAVIAMAVALVFQTAEKNAWLIKLLGAV